MKGPSGASRTERSCGSKMEGPRPDKFQFAGRTGNRKPHKKTREQSWYFILREPATAGIWNGVLPKGLEMPLYDLNACIKAGNTAPVQTGRDVVLVTPTYAWRIPRVVSGWLGKTALTGAERIWFVMDCGSEIGNAAGYNRQLAAQKQLQYMGTAQIIMPETTLPCSMQPQKEQARSIVEQAEPGLQKVLTRLRAGQEITPAERQLLRPPYERPGKPGVLSLLCKSRCLPRNGCLHWLR